MIEPSDIERGELPETSAAYMTYLETENEALREEVLRLELENKSPVRIEIHQIIAMKPL